MIVEINAAGCSDTCRHCSVHGHHPMGAFYSVDELRAIRQEWGELTIRYEPTLHPDFPRIYQADIAIPHGGWLVSNGYGLAHRPDHQTLLQALHEEGIHTVALTVHGLSAHHDWFVAREGAFDTIVTATRRVRASGFGVSWQIMVDKRGLDDLEELVAMAWEETGGAPSLSLPYHRVSERLWRYETLRVTLDDAEAYRLPELVVDPQLNAFHDPVSLTAAHWLNQWRQAPDSPAFKHPFEPQTWPLALAHETVWIQIDRNGSIHWDPVCAAPLRVGHLRDGRAAIEARLAARPAPALADLHPEAISLTPEESADLHPAGFSLRLKAIAKARRAKPQAIPCAA